MTKNHVERNTELTRQGSDRPYLFMVCLSPVYSGSFVCVTVSIVLLILVKDHLRKLEKKKKISVP